MTRSQDRPPRLLQMMLSTQSGGAETFFEKLALGFAAAGVPQCLVIEPDAKREALLSGFEGTSVEVIRFGGLREWSARRRLRRRMQDWQPDVALTWMNRASRRAPVGFCPVVGRLGGYYALKYYRRCDHLVGITPDICRHLTEGGRPESEVSLIPNFGETAQAVDDVQHERAAVRRELGIAPDAAVLLALGRLHKVKAHDTLLRSLQQLPGVVLMLAGDGPLESGLRSLAQDLGISDRVHFLGWRRDTGRLFAACDISVFPSRYEPNGTVVMESWAQRRPLVAARAKGPEWLVDDGVNGLLFPIDDVAVLTQCIRRLLDDPALAARLTEGGSEKFRSGFTREVIVERYLGLFRELIAGPL